MSALQLAGIALAVLIGAFLPLQALINAQLGRATAGPLFASFLSFLIGTLALGATLLVLRAPLPSTTALGQVPAWAWLGGLIGATYVFSATLLVPRLGATALICLIVLGQILASLWLDHVGVLGEVRVADPVRVAGALLVLIGAVLVVQPWRS